MLLYWSLLQRRRLHGDRTCTLNILTGFCTCLDNKLHHVCAHLLAARAHAEYASLGNWSATLPPPPADPQAPITVMREPPLPLPADVEEPLSCFDADLELAALLKAAKVRISNSSRERAQPLQGDPETIAFVQALRRTGNNMLQLSKRAHLAPEVLPALVAQHADTLEQLNKDVQAAMPQLHAAAPAGKQGRRKDTDRTMPALYKRKSSHEQRSDGESDPHSTDQSCAQSARKRTRSQAVSAQRADGEGERFVKAAAPGRRRTVITGPGEFGARTKASAPLLASRKRA
jgi:hypothetical protein